MGGVLWSLPLVGQAEVWLDFTPESRKLVRFLLPVLATTYLLYSFAIKPFLSPLRKMPGLPYHPLFGNVREAMRGEAMDASTRWVAKYGGVLRYYGLLGRESVLVADPDAMKRVLVSHQHKYTRPNPKTVPLGRSVLTVTGEEHKVLRRLLNPVFSPERIKSHLPVFEELAYKLVNFWSGPLAADEEGRLEVQTDLFRMTFDVFGKAVLGCDFDSLLNPESSTVQAFKFLLSFDSISYASIIPFYNRLPTAQNRAWRHSLNIVNTTIRELIQEKQELLNSQTALPADAKHDLLRCLVTACDKESGRGLSPTEIRDNLFTLIFAGHETTAMTMSWILLTLAQNPEIQVKVRSEVNQVIQGEGQLRWEDLERLKYLERVIKEGQRLYPAAATVPRLAKEEDELGGYRIPAGTPVTCHFGSLMRNPAVWSNPEVFDPDRFLDASATPRLYAYLPFGSGPTKCLGHMFARVQMRVVLAVLIKHFTFDTIPGFSVQRKHRVTLKAVPPIELIVRRVGREIMA